MCKFCDKHLFSWAQSYIFPASDGRSSKHTHFASHSVKYGYAVKHIIVLVIIASRMQQQYPWAYITWYLHWVSPLLSDQALSNLKPFQFIDFDISQVTNIPMHDKVTLSLVSLTTYKHFQNITSIDKFTLNQDTIYALFLSAPPSFTGSTRSDI